jgi:phosphatidate phosphatase PAH1
MKCEYGCIQADGSLFAYQKLQNVDNGYSLPAGPLFLNPRVATKALVEATTNPNVQKTRTLNTMLDLFPDRGGVVYAAYGNTDTDTKAYVDAGIDVAKIYIVNEEGVLTNGADGAKTSYTVHANDVNQLFPSIK